MKPAWPKVVAPEHRRAFNPPLHRFARRLGDLELDGPLGLALHYRCPLFHVTRYKDITHLQPYAITAPELAVDGHIEQGKVADVLRDLNTHADCPNMLWQKWAFLADDPALIPSRGFEANDGKVNGRHGFSSILQARPFPCNLLMTKNTTDRDQWPLPRAASQQLRQA